MLLIFQALFALIATFRGHGFKPWAVMITVLLVGVGLGFMGVTSLGFYFIVDLGTAGFLAWLAFFKERPSSNS